MSHNQSIEILHLKTPEALGEYRYRVVVGAVSSMERALAGANISFQTPQAEQFQAHVAQMQSQMPSEAANTHQVTIDALSADRQLSEVEQLAEAAKAAAERTQGNPFYDQKAA